MKKFLSSVSAAGIALAVTLSGMAPSFAAPLRVQAAEAPAAGVVEVQFQDMRRAQREARQDRREFRQDMRQDRREFRRESNQDRREFRREARQDRASARLDRRGDRYFYRGHRGYREYRPGYRQVDGWWFPAAAFVAGAIVTGAINNSGVSSGSTHVQWCANRYRSYRASDNTFQPYNGPRQQCYSPYD